jgi:hypothetical protein
MVSPEKTRGIALTLIIFPAAMLYMLEITQLVSYFQHFGKRDKLLLKVLVILCFMIDTLCTIAICGWVFLVRPSLPPESVRT